MKKAMSKMKHPIIASVFENKSQLMISFSQDSSGDLHATEISKTSLGASAGFSFESKKERSAYLGKKKMKYVGRFVIEEYIWKGKGK